MPTLEKLKSRLKQINQEILELNNSITKSYEAIEVSTDAVSEKIKGYEEASVAHNREVESAQIQLSEFRDRADKFERQLNRNKSDFTQLASDYDTWNARLKQHQDNIDKLNRKIDEYNNLISNPGYDQDRADNLRDSIDSESERIRREDQKLADSEQVILARLERLKEEEERLAKEDKELFGFHKTVIEPESKRLEEQAAKLTIESEEIEEELDAIEKMRDDIDSLDKRLREKIMEKESIELEIANFNDHFKVSKGQLTFDVEGNEGGRYHSRTPHVPSDASGVTIGRGYDMKKRSSSEIIGHLTKAGLGSEEARAYSGAAGLSGQKARNFINENRNALIEISPRQQKVLFEITYALIEKDVIRICNKPDVVKAYGTTDWNALNIAIKDVVVDMRFRGDYHPQSRRIVQPHIVKNDLESFYQILSNKENWPTVPKDRFEARVKYLRAARPQLFSLMADNTDSTHSTFLPEVTYIERFPQYVVQIKKPTFSSRLFRR
ncbi:hypothetical protein QGP82_21530 [Leptothoe sp. LEGE 181152]|nr:hypothetical protein [Leptothoe sp. LEGE 181152]